MRSPPEGLPLCPEPGTCLAGKYVIDGVIGTGGMSVVVAAFHKGLRQKVAIKLLSTSNSLPPDGVGRFLREARAAAALRSEHTARVVDVDVDESGRHFIVMEHLEGEDLGQLLKRNGTLPIATAVGYVLHACEAMAEAHALGIIHRDLKPQNLFLTRHLDGTPLIKVLDFGISKVAASDLQTGKSSFASTHRTLLGTPHYMSPEQIRTPGEIDGRSDIWSLGVILFELLTHAEPFPGETIPDVLASVLQCAPLSPSALRGDVPAALASIVLACLEKEASQRIAHVGILAESLRPWAPAWALDAATRAARISSSAQVLLPGSSASADAGVWSLPLARGQAHASAPFANPERKGRYRLLGYGAVAALGVSGWVSFAWFDPVASRDGRNAPSLSHSTAAPAPRELPLSSVGANPAEVAPAPPLPTAPGQSVAMPVAAESSRSSGSASLEAGEPLAPATSPALEATGVAKAKKGRVGALIPGNGIPNKRSKPADPLADRR